MTVLPFIPAVVQEWADTLCVCDSCDPIPWIDFPTEDGWTVAVEHTCGRKTEIFAHE